MVITADFYRNPETAEGESISQRLRARLAYEK